MRVAFLIFTAKVAETSLGSTKLLQAHQVEINDKTRVSNSLLIVLHFLWLEGQYLHFLDLQVVGQESDGRSPNSQNSVTFFKVFYSILNFILI